MSIIIWLKAKKRDTMFLALSEHFPLYQANIAENSNSSKRKCRRWVILYTWVLLRLLWDENLNGIIIHGHLSKMTRLINCEAGQQETGPLKFTGKLKLNMENELIQRRNSWIFEFQTVERQIKATKGTFFTLPSCQ
ncbi:MAG: hypothetical protein DRP65_08585 [Planctomycetota bacterium]|nr:MAG: hypothetical protein DRP65_08585 [Planctomycetota bacterium]